MLGLIALYVAVFETICVTKYRFYLYRDFDLAIFAQAVNGLLHGTWFSSIRGMNWLGDHSSLILIPLAPLYALAPSALTLLTVQTLALGLGAWPLYRLAKRELPFGSLPIACAALWLLHPALGYLNVFEFHPEALAPPLLLWCALELRSGRTNRAWLAAGLALLAREDVALPVLGLALIAAVFERPRQPRMAIGLAVLAIVFLVLSFGVLKPHLLEGEATYGKMYKAWGDSGGEIVRNLVMHPFDALATLWNTPGDATDTLVKRQYWLQMFLPVSGLALLAPVWLIPALPVFAEHFLSDRTSQHAIVYQYTALVLPFVALAAVGGLRRVMSWLAVQARPAPAAKHARGRAASAVRPAGSARVAAARATVLGFVLVVVAFTTQLLYGPITDWHVWQKTQRNEEIWPDPFESSLKPYRDRMLVRVPRTGAIVAGFEFLSHLANHPALHSMHHVLSGTYTYSDRPYPLPHDVRAVLGDMSGQIRYMKFNSGERLRAIAAEHDLRPADAAGGTVLMLEGARDSVEFYRVGTPWEHVSLNLVADDQLLLLGAERLDSTVVAGGVARIASSWRRVGPVNREYLVQVWLVQGNKVEFYGRVRSLCYGIFPLRDWPRDTVVRETYHLLVPTNVKPGFYRPIFRLIARDSLGGQSLPTVHVGNITEPMNLVGLADVEVLPPAKKPAR